MMQNPPFPQNPLQIGNSKRGSQCKYQLLERGPLAPSLHRHSSNPFHHTYLLSVCLLSITPTTKVLTPGVMPSTYKAPRKYLWNVRINTFTITRYIHSTDLKKSTSSSLETFFFQVNSKILNYFTARGFFV